MAIALCLGIVVLAIVLFAIESVPMEVAGLAVVCLLALTGVVSPKEAFSGFSNDTVIFIFSLLAMTQGLSAAGVVHLIGQRLSFFARYGHQIFVLAMMVVVCIFSAFVSNTVTTAAFLPVAIGAASRANVPKSKVLMPLAYASMLGGTTLLFGTSTNLVVAAAMRDMGMVPLGVAELAPMGVILCLAGVALVVLLGPLLLPARADPIRTHVLGSREYLTEAVLTPDSRYLGRALSDITDGLGLRVVGVLRQGTPVPANPTLAIGLQDKLLIEGKRDDILRVKDLRGIEIKSDLKLSEPTESKDTMLAEASVPPGSPLVNRSLRELLFAQRFGLIALGMHRRPNIQRLTKLQLLGRLWGGDGGLASMPLSVGDVLLLRGPASRFAELGDGGSLVVLSDIEYRAPRYAKAFLATMLFLGALAVAALNVVPMAVVGLTGMLLMIATGCVDAREAFRVDWRVLVLIGSMFALGVAVEKTGTGLFIGEQLARFASVGGPKGVLVALMVVTMFLSVPMSNQAAALVVLPIAVATAAQLGLEPRPFIVAVCLAASCSFITPLEPSCVLVYGPGHYRFSDFFRLGTPLTLLLLLALSMGVPHFWPLVPATVGG
ncbi:MAG: SLC13 family permease [Myxococcaceae bacterium]